jgi:hypothetical protein
LSALISIGYLEIAAWLDLHKLTDDRTSPDGKSGLSVLIMIIEKSLSPNMDESQRILAGPLIADLVQKVNSSWQLTYVGGD